MESTDVAAPGGVAPGLEARLAALGEELSTERVDALNELAWEIGFRDVKRTEALAREATTDARALAYKKGIAWGLLNSAFHDYFTGNYEAAMEKGGEALIIFEEIDDRFGVGNTLMGSGLVYWSLGDFERAVSDLHTAVEIFGDLHTEEREAWALTSLGGVYENLGDLVKAVECHRRALDLFRAKGQTLGESRALTGLGVVYQRQGALAQALERHFESLALAERMSNPVGVSRALNDIGTIHQSQGDLDQAEEFLTRALQIRTEAGNLPAKITSLLDLGKVYLEKGEVSRALEHHREFQQLKEKVLGEETATKLRNQQIQLQSETVAKLRNAQAKLIQSARMATLGKLAAGIAHEINTPVGVIQASTDVAARVVRRLAEENAAPVPDAARFRATLETLETHRATVAEAGRRLSEIVSNLKKLTNLDQAELQFLDLNDTLDSILALVEPQWNGDVKVVKDFGPLPKLQAYPAELNQAFLTLLLNAGEAIVGEGTVSVKTRSVDERIHVTATDTGRGMPAEQLSDVFDVGFSRRGSSIGLHVGLAHVKTTVEKHGGEIEVRSEPGRGTTFSITLPLRPR